MKLKYYRCLFKHNGEPWSLEAEVLAYDLDDAFEQAMRFAERHGYDDFTVM